MADEQALPQRRFCELAEVIGAERGKASGWKQAFAADVGISAGHLSRVLSGKRAVSDEVLRRAAHRFGLHPEVFGEDETPMAQHRARALGGPSDRTRVSSTTRMGGEVSHVEVVHDRETLLDAARRVVQAYSETRMIPAEAIEDLERRVAQLSLLRAAAWLREANPSERAEAAVRLAIVAQNLVLGPPSST